jgi:hypothetical protein
MSAVVSTAIGFGGFQFRQRGQVYMLPSRNHFASGMRGARKSRCDFKPGPLGVSIESHGEQLPIAPCEHHFSPRLMTVPRPAPCRA